MYYTVIKHSGDLRTLEKCRKHLPAARVFYISLVFSNVRRVLSQCNTRLRLLYLLNNDISLERYIVMNPSRAVRYVAAAIYRKNDISARYRREAPISRRIIVATHRLYVRCIAEISWIYLKNKERYSAIIVCITFSQYIYAPPPRPFGCGKGLSSGITSPHIPFIQLYHLS